MKEVDEIILAVRIELERAMGIQVARDFAGSAPC